MLEYDFLKRLILLENSIETIDCNKSYYSFDSNTNNFIIEIYLKKDYCKCEICLSQQIKVQKTFISNLRTQTIEGTNAIAHIHRRTYICNNGHVHRQDNPFKEKGDRISISKDIAILNELRDKTNTYSSVAKRFQVSPTYVIDLFDKRVDLKRLTLPDVLCVDEVYGRKLTNKGYCFVLYSPQWRKIIDVLDSRKKLDLIDYFARIPLDEKKRVKFVSMDLYETYRDVMKKSLPNAKICADPFHVVKHLVACFDKIRKRVMRRFENYKSEGSNYYWLYKKYKWMLFKDLSKIKDGSYTVSKSKMIMNKYQIIKYMLDLDETLDLAYNLMMIYRNFVATATIQTAEYELNKIIAIFKEAHIPEYADFIRILNNWHDEIINSFNTINNHKITNGPMERTNENIKTIIRISFGSKNFTRTRNRIMFCINEGAPILANRKKQSNKQTGVPRGKYKKNTDK